MWSHGLILNIFSMFWLISIFLLNNVYIYPKILIIIQAQGILKMLLKTARLLPVVWFQNMQWPVGQLSAPSKKVALTIV